MIENDSCIVKRVFSCIKKLFTQEKYIVARILCVGLDKNNNCLPILVSLKTYEKSVCKITLTGKNSVDMTRCRIKIGILRH